MRKEPLRVGFLGASKVAMKASLAIHRAGHRVTFIGCRDADRGWELAERLRKDIEADAETKESGAVIHQPFVAPSVGSYMDVVRSDRVDLVYISLPTSKRSAWIRLCADYGKHVVSEKPAASSAAELVECLQRMAENRLLFMDGTALSHSQRLQDVRSAVAQLRGPVHINAHMSFPASPTFMANDIRMQPLLEPHGALGDLGWYCIRWILHIVDFALPTGVTGRVTECDALGEQKVGNDPQTDTATDASSAGAPATTASSLPRKTQNRPAPAAITGFEGDLEFTLPTLKPNNVVPTTETETETTATVTASFRCSFHECHDQTVEIFCRDGTVVVHGAINPTAEDRPRFEVLRHTVAAAPATATREETSPVGIAKVFQTHEHLEEERNDVVYSTAETSGAQQMVQLWRDVESSVMRLGKSEPLIASADHAKKWSMFAYLTQVVMDRTLEAASQHALAPTAPSTDT